ncbi:M15 family metallopeptidase [Streptomyces sp. NBC_00053]|uniref:M15 family metallopeptidase n=1 Tax=unclassified Streptomyces TaxID=2593676 RepID=UPI000F5C03B3|nr:MULTISPECIES: M15 family metallopeptidase [unclassified Streptomyces]WSG54418.1 M15 family metallopeptidase [Streptomyces sp. NBC_01732]WSX05137.1 M15 family metallopeptidase [Streptomyces sp. NBC_00987]MCX5104773.1 M15 family metallopeptidase [Streptomyces sp. NBC_00439]MCX5164178.1 M15 family metallopeptidase [Streptomyces sp. NBC_00305]MCX5222702.1 M15 family metallopeptidase [Streptomyces sp. NBC_00264]
MHDNPAESRSATAARRLPGRTAAGVGAVLVVALTAAWGLTTRSEPAAHADATAGRPPGGGAATAEATPEGADESGTPDGRRFTPFDTRYPAIARLDKRLLKAVQQAARDARDDGIEFRVTSGWRSKEHQQRLLDEGIEKYGSAEKARQFVNTPQKSTHVSGKAVDIGPTDADDWLIRNGSDYGLCQVYNNEMWHFELLTRPGGTCPAPLSNAAG